MTVAFIGLGVMGGPMAGHLLKQCKHIVAYNRTASKAMAWQKQYPSGQIASDLTLSQNDSVDTALFQYHSLSSLISETTFIISCIGKDEDVKALSDEIAVHGQPGLIWVDHTTISANLSTEIHQTLKSKDIGFIDAPISGGEAGAQNGTLTAMCGGEHAIFEKVSPLLEAYCKQAILVGPSGHGQLTKMVNQICLVGVLQGLSEGLHFGKQSGLDMSKVLEAISKGAAQSWQMDNRAKTMIKGDFDFGFAIDLARKDLGICFEQAKSLGVTLPITKRIDALYSEIQAKGGGKLDTSALIKQFD